MLGEILLFVIAFLGGHLTSQWLSMKSSLFVWINRAIIMYVEYRLKNLKRYCKHVWKNTIDKVGGGVGGGIGMMGSKVCDLLPFSCCGCVPGCVEYCCGGCGSGGCHKNGGGEEEKIGNFKQSNPSHHSHHSQPEHHDNVPTPSISLPVDLSGVVVPSHSIDIEQGTFVSSSSSSSSSSSTSTSTSTSSTSPTTLSSVPLPSTPKRRKLLQKPSQHLD